MAGAVSQTTADFNSVWQGSALFSATVLSHNNNLIAVNALEVKQNQAFELKGLVRDKNLLRIFIIDAATRIVSAIKGYASSTDNQQLKLSVRAFTASGLKRMSDTKFLTAISTVKEIATDNAAGILPFGITAQMITDFGTDITSFDSISKKPKALRSQLKMFTAQLKEAIIAMLANLKNNMDNQVRSLYPGSDFAQAYFNSRKIYNYNESVTGFKGTVYNSETGKRLSNVIIELVDYPSPGENILHTTNADGNYAFKKLSLATATIRVRAIGFTTAEYEVRIIKDRLIDFDIQLMPQPAPVPVNA